METKEVVTPAALANYLGIDDADDMCRANLSVACQTANSWLVGALGAGADLTDPRAMTLGLLVASDVYDHRSYADDAGKAASSTRKLVRDLSDQLRCEAMARGGGDGS